MRIRFLLPLWAFCLVATCFIACANPGSRPDGGAYDETPPVVVSLNPSLGARNVKGRKMVLTFSEAIKVEGMQDKVVVSPPHEDPPEITTIGRRIHVAFPDTLRHATTYTIDFSDAIVDATEGNPLGAFTYFFSTGEELDTMEISGHVLDFSTLEPLQGMLVGLHSNLADSAFTKLPFERVARTDQNGFFCIKGVKADTDYRIFALQDQDQDYRLSRGERLAFLADTLRPASFPDVRRDTLWRDSIYYDSVRTVPYTHYTPDDVVLLAFQEKSTFHGLLKSRRDEPNRLSLIFTAPQDTLPLLCPQGFDDKGRTILWRSAGNDSLTVWLTDSALINTDTLTYVVHYPCTNDSTEEIYQRTDTLQFVPRFSFERRQKIAQQEREKFEKAREKRHKKGDYSLETPPPSRLQAKWKAPSVLAPDRNPYFTLDVPAAVVDTSLLQLLLVERHELPPEVDEDGREVRRDTTLYLPRPYRLECDTLLANAFYTLRAEWRPGQAYELRLDSAFIKDIAGAVSEKRTIKFQVGDTDAFGSLFLLLPDADSTAVAQLLVDDKKIYRTQKVQDGRADFFYLDPGTYYLRLFNDRNGNGVIDPGCYADGMQGEEVFYNPNTFVIRAAWDIEQTWHIRALPATRQRPSVLKPKTSTAKKTAHERNLEREKKKK